MKEKLLPIITGIFVGVLILSNILASKMIQLGPFVFDGGTLLFPLSYIFGDVLTEVYGYKASRKVIWTGFFMIILMSINIWIIGILPAEETWIYQNDYNNILMLVPRIVLASLIGYFSGEFSNSFILSKIKIFTKGKYLWIRTIGSTLIGELLDSIIFVFIAFLGIYSINILLIMIFSNYLFKTVIEIIFTPITYKIIKYVKIKEGIDIYDYNINYNPFSLKNM
ncbi:MAG: queuosine precursor transporter [Candidatus Nanoarchaeia archaeon]|jgi:hypothetical protein|nr:queuosine precursor transporter [Candidatus Nanoarchaeia archaeon]